MNVLTFYGTFISYICSYYKKKMDNNFSRNKKKRISTSKNTLRNSHCYQSYWLINKDDQQSLRKKLSRK